jgi:hypothetical protein
MICEPHLSTKSIQRVDMIFDFFTRISLLDLLFNPANSESLELRTRIIKDIVALLDSADDDK